MMFLLSSPISRSLLPFGSLLLLLLLLSSTTTYGQDAISGGVCTECVDSTKSVISCSIENSCDYKACLDTAEEEGASTTELLDAIKNCCPACNENIETAIGCINGCLPCLQETATTYFVCASLDVHNCTEACDETLTEYYDTATSDTDGSGLFSILEEYTATGDEIDPDGTCDALEGDIEAEVCDAANCCPYCIDEFEAVAECAASLFTDAECDIECGSNIVWTPDIDVDVDIDLPDIDVGNVVDRNGNTRHRRHRRKLQNTPPTPPGADGGGDGTPPGPPGDMPQPPNNDGSQPQQPPDFSKMNAPPPVQALLDHCRDTMGALIAVDLAEVAFDTYLSCITTSVIENLPEKMSDGNTDESDSDEDESDSSGGNASINVRVGLAAMVTLSLPLMNMFVW